LLRAIKRDSKRKKVTRPLENLKEFIVRFFVVYRVFCVKGDNRLLHHAETIVVEGKNYRMNDQIEAD